MKHKFACTLCNKQVDEKNDLFDIRALESFYAENEGHFLEIEDEDNSVEDICLSCFDKITAAMKKIKEEIKQGG